jgi:uncharacterized damage-inducible protein DinB
LGIFSSTLVETVVWGTMRFRPRRRVRGLASNLSTSNHNPGAEISTRPTIDFTMRTMTSDDNLLCRPFRQLARNALLSNRRLDIACMALAPGEWEAERTSFFPSLKETMVHLLDADRWYIDTFRGNCPGIANEAGSRATAAEFARERAEVDAWLVDYCESLTAEGLSREIVIEWPDRTFAETLADTLLHFFMHGQHHRGQVHAMLAGSSVTPPQLDEFIQASITEPRADDLAALGWDEARLTR